MGVNVRFDEGKVRRAPVFRNVKDTLVYAAVRFRCIPSYRVRQCADGKQ